MSLTFLSPLTLLWLAIVPAFWLVGRRRGISGLVHRVSRTALATLVLIALAGPVISRPASSVAVIHLVDVSHSVSSRSLDSVALQIDQTNTDLGPAFSRILLFAGRETSVSDTAALRRLATDDGAKVVEAALPD